MSTGAMIRDATNAASSQAWIWAGNPVSQMALYYAATFDTPGIYPSCCSRATRAWRAASNLVVALLKASHASFDRETAAKPV